MDSTIPITLKLDTNSDSAREKQSILDYRLNILPFPEMDSFYNILQDRLHMLLSQLFLKQPFTIFLTALPRRVAIHKIKRSQLSALSLISAGIGEQRQQLEHSRPIGRDLDRHWNLLKATEIMAQKGEVNSKLFAEYATGDVNLWDIPEKAMGTMSSYFASLTEADLEQSLENPQTRAQAEYQIVKQHLSIEGYWYLSLPLVQFSEFDGLAHIVLHNEDQRRLLSQGKEKASEEIGKIIKIFSREYEGVVLDWDLAEDNTSKMFAIEKAIRIAIVLASAGSNHLFKELGYLEYYRRHYTYFLKRLELQNAIPGQLYQQSQKNAITTILIDSFAHNVSAHSLTALNWAFKERSKIVEHALRQRELNMAKLELRLKGITGQAQATDLSEFLQQEVVPLLEAWRPAAESTDNGGKNGIAAHPLPMSRELQPLLKFLLEKGAFWSGVTRDYGFGGEIKSLFDTLWQEFLNNPLYLGTIAQTENITKIDFRVIVYEPEEKSSWEGGVVRKKIAIEGVLASINVNRSRKKDHIEYRESDGKEIDETQSYALLGEEKLHYQDYPEMRIRSNFVDPGRNYPKLREALKATHVFFPGGVVGRHALFTMLENEIRNVKHYSGQTLKRLQQTGKPLTLVISVQERHVENSKISDEKELYKIGVWLDLDTDLCQKIYRKDSSTYLIERRFSMLMQDIIDETETKAPRLGGNYQDKVCAAMLFNNRFRSVQLGDDNVHRPRGMQDRPRDRHYYPWIIPATSCISTDGMEHIDFEITRDYGDRLKDTEADFEKAYTELFDTEAKIKTGRLKKYFHLWRGTDVKTLQENDTKMWEWENPSRFRFVFLDDTKKTELSRIREFGVIRVLCCSSLEGDCLSVVEAYRFWLQQWLEGQPPFAYLFKRREERNSTPTDMRHLIYDGQNEHIAYFSNKRPDHIPPEKVKTLVLAHGGGGGGGAQPTDLRYRSHGFFQGNKLDRIADFNNLRQHGTSDEQEKHLGLAAEFLEAVETKVAIFDNRVHQRIVKRQDESSAGGDLFSSALNLLIAQEELPGLDGQGIWENAKAGFLKSVHFLVIHLSYIEHILKEKYGNKVDKDAAEIGFFVQNELQDIAYRNGRARDNFILVITSGRGRDEWWQKLRHSKNKADRECLKFTTFRPVESIISVVEDNVNREDDIDLKYHLIKVLFGS